MRMIDKCMIPPVSTPEQRAETNTSPATIESDRVIRLALAEQRREMQEALSEAAQ